VSSAGETDIAVVGMAGGFAGAAGIPSFRQAVLDGRPLLGPPPAQRFSWPVPPSGAMLQPIGGYLPDADCFDAALFGVGRREAARMDPQVRLLLHAARAAMEDAGHAPARLAGRCIGVFAANTFQDWLPRLRRADRIAKLRMTDTAVSMLANHISRAFDLRGPSEVVNACCAGGLLALHRAAMSLRAGECEAALACGVSLVLAADSFVTSVRAGMLSRSGRGSVLDATTDGFLRGEGYGAVLLKPLAAALADRDHIHVVIRGSIANHAGAPGCYTAEHSAKQAEPLVRLLAGSDVDPATIGYMELQGSGHAADDAAELAVVAAAFRATLAEGAALPVPGVGYLKPLTGHLEAASGIAQLVKVAAVLRAGRLPVLPEVGEPTVDVAAAWPGMATPAVARAWPTAHAPRRALISGFGFGGTQVHMLLEEPAAMPAPADAPPRERAFFLSAATPELLVRYAAEMAGALTASEETLVDDVAATLLVGRDAMPERLVILESRLAQVAEQLASFAAAPETPGPWLRGSVISAGRPMLGSEPEDREWLAGMVRAGRWRKLTDLWVRGLDLDWATLGDALPGRRVPLPPMALATTRFWLDDSATGQESATSSDVRQQDAVAASAARDEPIEIDRRLDVMRGLLVETLGLSEASAPAATDIPAALGMDSMAATELRARITNVCGVNLPLPQIIAARSVGALAAMLPADMGAPLVPASLPPPDAAAQNLPFPVTDMQFAYLIGRQELRADGGFGCQAYLEFSRTRFDVTRLAEALDRLVARHDMLRAVFSADATQRILPAHAVPPIEIPLHDLSNLPPADAAARRAEVAARFLADDFDPGQFPLLRAAVTRDAEQDRLHVAFDLLIADGPSVFLLLEEWAALHDAPDTPLPPIRCSFLDYVVAIRERGDSPASRAARAYWDARLDSLPDAPILPMLPGEPQTVGFRRHSAILPTTEWRAFERSAAAHAVTSNAALIAAFADALAVWTARPEFCLNITLASREPLHPDVSRLVGDFTGNLLLAIPDRGTRTFAEHAGNIARQLAADIEHAGHTATQVLGALSRRRRKTARMPVVFTALHGYGALLKRPVSIDAIGRFIAGATRTPEVWLDAQAMETADGLNLSWDFLDGIFAPDVLADMFAGFLARVRRLATDPAAWVTPPAIPSGVLSVTAHAANRSAARLKREPIFAGILRQAALAPAAEAVVAADRRLCFGELAREAAELAARLTAAGVRPGALVAVILPKGWRQVVAVVAIGMAGAAYVPMELPLPAQRIRDLLERAGACLAIVAEPIDTAGWPCPPLHFDLGQTAGPTVAAPATVAPGDLAYVIFTSGSTGSPKGVAMSHGAVANTLHDIGARFELTPSDRVLGLSSLGFDLSVWDVFGVLGAGGALILPAPDSVRDPAYLAALAARERVTLWNSTPLFLKLVFEATGAALPETLRLVMLSGDWIPLALARQVRAELPAARLISLGGATEAAIWSIWHPVDQIDDAWRSIPYGRPLANQRFHVLDDEWRPCPAGEVGQLHIGGSGLADGYWRDPERSAASFCRHPETGERLYRTGDYGRRLPDGTIEFLGRRDQQVKIGGHRVELAEVEQGLLSHPGVAEAVALAVEDAGSNLRLVAAYSADAEITATALRTALAARLPHYLVPTLMMHMPRMPLTQNGKVDRRAIGERAAGRLGGSPSPNPCSVSPQSIAAADPAAVLATVLQDPGILLAPDARDAFVAAGHGARRDLHAMPCMRLADIPVCEGAALRCSTRAFLPAPVTARQIAALLTPLRASATGKRRYGSAGSSYAVQTYLIVHRRDGDVAPGLWYFEPATQRIIHFGECPVSTDSLHIPANRRVAAAAAITILLVGDLAAIRPLYGDHAADMLRIEAGAMAQLLSDEAARLSFGLCAIGWLDLAPLAGSLRLTSDHVLLHALVGGQPAIAAAMTVSEPAPASSVPPMPGLDSSALVRAAWERVLGHAEFSDTASFFEVGGNSFLAVALQARLAELLEQAPSVTELFRYPTVQALAGRIARRPLPADRPAETMPPTRPVLPAARPVSTELAASQRSRRLVARQRAGSGGRS
jgi:amino acid adenylation domain-containing protein